MLVVLSWNPRNVWPPGSGSCTRTQIDKQTDKQTNKQTDRVPAFGLDDGCDGGIEMRMLFWGIGNKGMTDIL